MYSRARMTLALSGATLAMIGAANIRSVGRVAAGGECRPYRTVYRLNRSRRYKPAKSYAHARAMSPVPHMAVR